MNNTMHKNALAISLDQRSIYLREMAIKTLESGKRAHLGSAMSIMELIRVLYDDFLNYDNTNLKDKNYYTNTDITYAYASGAATGSYGTATAKDLDQLKDKQKGAINREAYSNLQDSDWLVIRAAEGGTAVTSTWTTYRAAVSTKSNDMETLIDGAANVDALAALYVYSADVLYTAEEEAANAEHIEGTIKTQGTRPLGKWPSKPS